MTQPGATTKRKRLLTVGDVMAELGIGRTKLYELLGSGALPSLRVGGLRRIRPEALDAYLQKREDEGR